MRILQVTNIISHHQIPLARELVKLVGVDNFRFATTEKPSIERAKLGWNNSITESWILRAGENERDRLLFEKWWSDADVVICGERLIDKMIRRIKNKKLTFYMSERWWKPPIKQARLLHPKFLLMAMRFWKLSKSPYFHYLSIGDYAAEDIRFISDFRNRIWRWGYFTSSNDFETSHVGNDDSFKVMWAGRMLDWKKVDTLIKAFGHFESKNDCAELTIIGDGPTRSKLLELARVSIRKGKYLFKEPQSPEIILNLMREHDIYVLPSNAYEGWGAVVNEAMSVGCAVVASSDTGAGRTLIKDGNNGLLFESGDWLTLSKHLNFLSQNSKARSAIANNGRVTVNDLWTPLIAAERLIFVSSAILKNSSFAPFSEGPFSLVSIIKDIQSDV